MFAETRKSPVIYPEDNRPLTAESHPNVGSPVRLFHINHPENLALGTRSIILYPLSLSSFFSCRPFASSFQRTIPRVPIVAIVSNVDADNTVLRLDLIQRLVAILPVTPSTPGKQTFIHDLKLMFRPIASQWRRPSPYRPLMCTEMAKARVGSY